MIGRKYGRLTVASLSHRDERHRRFYLCACSCGGEKIVQGGLLLSHNTKSCGCLAREQRARQRPPGEVGPITQIILQYKRGARDRGLDWLLTRAEVDGMVRKPCHYCGIAAGNLKRTKNYREGFAHNGIDRIDNAKGYTSDNTVPCCGTCNRAKVDRSHDEFIAWAKQIARQWGGLVEE